MEKKRKRHDTSGGHNKRHRCSFGEVEIREYNIMLGGGGGIPSEGGPPLGLGWDVVNQSHTSLADFELTRIGVRSPREVYMSEGFLSARQRSRILKQVGHTKKEIKKATRKVEELVTARWELNTVRADNWLFDTQSAESALEVASDLGFERSETKIIDGINWHHKAAILSDICKLSSQAAASSQIWREVRTAARKWFLKDCAFVLKCPPRCGHKSANKARSRIARFVDCLASTWQDIQEEETTSHVGSLAVILHGWDDPRMDVSWKNKIGGFYEIEELCI